MKSLKTAIVLLCLILFATHVWAEHQYAPGRLMVKFKETTMKAPGLKLETSRGLARTGVASIDELNTRFNASEIRKAHPGPRNQALARQLEIDRWHVLQFPESMSMVAMAALYKNNPHIAEATPDWRAFPMTLPNDPHYDAQWGHNNTGQFQSFNSATGQHDGPLVGTVGFDGSIQAAWSELGHFGSSTIIIGIIDSGVDLNHPDLVDNLVPGWDFGSNDADPDDDSAQPGHGTACAGVAAARANNAIGVAGVAGGSKIMPLKVANDAGIVYFSAVQNALHHAADNGVHIVSMSFGNSEITSDPLTDAMIQYAYNRGVTLLAATGNEGANTIAYPARNRYVISVGAASPCNERKSATSCDGQSEWGSNYGVDARDAAAAVDIIAPSIIPTTVINDDYTFFFNGTSSATPFAAGVCALILSRNPTWTPAQVRQQLVMTATDVVNAESGSGWDRFTGYGMVNAYAALTITPAENNPPVFTATGPFTVVAFAGEGTFVGDIDAHNGDGGATDAGITYTITENVDPDGDGIPAFTIHADTGVLTVADAGDLNDVLNPSLTITVQADDGVHQTSTDVTIHLTTPPAVTIRYVDSEANGVNNGTSWQDAYTDLQAALGVATSGDSIFVKRGTYKPTTDTNREISFNIPSGVTVYGHFAGNETDPWQRVLSNSAYETILSGDIGILDNNSDNSYHVVTFYGVSSTTRLDGFTITRGNAYYVPPGGPYNKDDPRNSGGGILNAGSIDENDIPNLIGEAGNPDIRNCLITENEATFGAGMFTSPPSSPTITNCRFISNRLIGGGRGGGLAASGSNVIVRDSIFSGNSGDGGSVAHAIDNGSSCSFRGFGKFTNIIIENHSGGSEAAFVNWEADPNITGCIIRNNSAIQGGGMLNFRSDPVITDCLFENNRSLGGFGGGGIQNEQSSPTITGSTFINNQGTYGAAISNREGSNPAISRSKFIGNSDGSAIYNSGNSNPVITSCLISGNYVASTSDTLAGGISNINSSPTIINSTISGNRTNTKGGGIYNQNANPIIHNTIIWGNAATLAGDEVYNATSSPKFSYSAIRGSGGSSSWNSAMGTDEGHNIDVNPAFLDPLHPSAAPTAQGNYRVFMNSPVIDAGNSSEISEELDLDGELRIQNGTVDMGAYEGGRGRVLFVKAGATGSNNGSSWTNAYPDLQDALDNAAAGDHIYIAGGVYKPDRGTGSRAASFVIPAGVKVYGHFAGTEGSFFDRTLDNPAHRTVLSGEIGSAGYANNSYHVVTFIDAGNSALLDGVTIMQGNADGSGNAGSGGGIFIQNSSPTVRNAIISGNMAVYGGGIATTGSSSPTLINCVLMGNRATFGGALSATASATPQLINCSISGNSADTNGGALYHQDASPGIRNSIIWGNSQTGGVIYNSGSANPSYAYSNVEASGGSASWNSNFGLDGGNNIDLDPLFVAAPAHTNAPTTQGELICYNRSPVVDGGSNNYVAFDTWYDLIGQPRIQNSTVDMGAYEGNPSSYVFYVKGDASGTNKGTSWANAFTDLQSALIRASAGDKVYVARGTYRPTTTTDRTISFRIPSGVEVYGHFNGTESGPNERNLSAEANRTVLSGDIGTTGDISDNTFNVVAFNHASASTILDGVTVSDGNAGTSPNDYGGGILCHNSSPLIRNCFIRGNRANQGGGMSINFWSNPTLVNCIFTENSGHLPFAYFRRPF